jgi:hypothetical protein
MFYLGLYTILQGFSITYMITTGFMFFCQAIGVRGVTISEEDTRRIILNKFKT